MTFEPADVKFVERVRESFGRQAFMAFLGAELGRVEPGLCEIGIDTRAELTQQHGFVHGGVLASIADSAAGYAAYSLMPADASPLTVEYKINILRPGGGDRVVARGQVVKPGRTLTIVRGDVFSIRDGVETLCVTSLQTLMTLRGRQDRLHPLSR